MEIYKESVFLIDLLENGKISTLTIIYNPPYKAISLVFNI